MKSECANGGITCSEEGSYEVSRGPSAFKQSDVVKAVKAIIAAGQTVKAVEITKDKITIMIGEPGAETGKPMCNPWDNDEEAGV